MQEVFYDFNKKTVLTPEQQENVVKVIILAKKLLIFISTHDFRETLKTNHFFVNSNAERLFYLLRKKLHKTNKIISLDGERYRLIMDRVNKNFSIYRKTENILLIRAGLKGHKVELVNGLNNQDIRQWDMISQVLEVNFKDSIIHK
ncbi:MAG: hypothetical protein AAFW70_01045 [Cyanobacteria bacterium J06635_10]